MSATRFRAWLELARVSNLPTVWTNALVGVCLGAGVVPRMPWREWGILCGGLSLLYIAGMILNDVADAEADRATRPERPIPSGRVSRRAALVAVVVSFALGLGLVGFVSRAALPSAGLLVACIVIYDVAHKRFGPALVFMGLCRGLVYVVCAIAVGPPENLGPLAAVAGAMMIYIVALTLLATREDETDAAPPARGLEFILPAVVLGPTALAAGASFWLTLGAGAVMLGWLLASFRHVWREPLDVRRAVMAWLAAICLADAYFLALLGALVPMLTAVGCFVMTVWGHRRILGT